MGDRGFDILGQIVQSLRSLSKSLIACGLYRSPAATSVDDPTNLHLSSNVQLILDCASQALQF
jgi:hypothetical protein